IGLFGTVWGIMTSFQSIAASKNTSLAVVAPGIAEALFATAIGLVAAIPATIFYNKFAAEVNKQAQRLEGFADEFSAILSRQIDERGGGDDMAAGSMDNGAARGGGKRRGRPRLRAMKRVPLSGVVLWVLYFFSVLGALCDCGGAC